jgi:hypothetical protein
MSKERIISGAICVANFLVVLGQWWNGLPDGGHSSAFMGGF